MNYKSGYSDYSTPPLYCLCTLSPPGEDGPAASMVCDIATSLAGASMVWPQSGRTGWLNWRDGRQVHGLPDDDTDNYRHLPRLKTGIIPAAKTSLVSRDNTEDSNTCVQCW